MELWLRKQLGFIIILSIFLHHFSKSLQLYLSIFIFEWPKMKYILFNIITNNLKTNCPRMLRIIFDSSSFSLILSFDRKLREDSIYFTICVWLTFNETTGKWNFKNSRELRTFIMHKCLYRKNELNTIFMMDCWESIKFPNIL